MLTDWDYTQVQDFSKVDQIFNEYDELDMPEVNGALFGRLGLPMLDMKKTDSLFFKKYYAQTYCPADPMTLEMEILRRHEGW